MRSIAFLLLLTALSGSSRVFAADPSCGPEMSGAGSQKLPASLKPFTWHDVRFRGDIERVQLAFTIFWETQPAATEGPERLRAYLALGFGDEALAESLADDWSHLASRDGCHAFFEIHEGDRRNGNLPEGAWKKLVSFSDTLLKQYATPG